MIIDIHSPQGYIPFLKRTVEEMPSSAIEDVERKFRSQQSVILLSDDETFLEKKVNIDIEIVNDFFDRLNKIFYGFILKYQAVESVKLRTEYEHSSRHVDVVRALDIHVAPLKRMSRMGIGRRHESGKYPQKYRPEERYILDIENLVIHDPNPITSYSTLNVLESMNKNPPLFQRVVLYNFPFSTIQENYERLENEEIKTREKTGVF